MASFSVVSNIASANAQANLYGTQVGLQKALNRLSSGFRINYSGDDAAGLAVANTFRNDVAVINQGIRNANDGLSVLQVKDGALANISTLLDRLGTLSTQAASDTTEVDRATLQSEADAIIVEINREITVADLGTTAFGVFVSNDGTNGAVSGTMTALTTGAGSLAIQGADATHFLDIDDATAAKTAVAAVKTAVATLGDVQGEIGTLQNRLQFAISLAQSQVVNTRAAESRIRDANVAEEAANMTRYNILTQSGIAALAQANQSTSAVLALLR